MEQQAQIPPVTPGDPEIPLHFWDERTTSSSLIGTLHTKGRQHPYEDATRLTWRQIFNRYFSSKVLPTGHWWDIDQKASEGLFSERWYQTKSFFIMAGVMPPLGILKDMVAKPGSETKDYLWMACKAAREDTPRGWKESLEESVGCLSAAHPNRTLLLIIAIGWRCMAFIWDPLDHIQGQERLFIRPTHHTEPWLVDKRIKAPLSTKWLDTSTGEIHCRHAMELGYQYTAQIGGQEVFRNQDDLALIEHLLVCIARTPFQRLDLTLFGGDTNDGSQVCLAELEHETLSPERGAWRYS